MAQSDRQATGGDDEQQTVGCADTGPIDTSELLNAIEADPDRKSFEKESRLLWSSSTDDVDVYTAEPGVMRRLLMHPDFALRWFEARMPGKEASKTKAYRTDDSDGLEAWEGTEVYGLEGSIPFGYVSIGSSPRRASGHAELVSENVRDNDPRK